MIRSPSINRLARATALKHELQAKGNTPRAARLADKVFGVADGYPCWNWASLYYKTALLTGTWGDIAEREATV